MVRIFLALFCCLTFCPGIVVAQEPLIPRQMPSIPTTPAEQPRTVPDRPPGNAPLDPNVEQSQLLQPVRPGSPGLGVQPSLNSTTVPPRAVVSDPPTPVVRIQVRTPAHRAPGKKIPYRIYVVNPSSAPAHKVTVKMPLPEGVLTKDYEAEPKPDLLPTDATNPSKEFIWNFKTLAAGESKTINLSFQPESAAREVRARAYVSFEYGEEVVTSIEKPKLEVEKKVPPETVVGEKVTVQVRVKNAGSVAINKVRLVEDASQGFQFLTDSTARKGQANMNQREWTLGSLAPGQAKIVTYQLQSKDAQLLKTSSTAASEEGVQSETITTETKLLTPALTVDFSGPATVDALAPAKYTLIARNTGSLTLRDVLVTIYLPEDCSLKSVTARAERYRSKLIWRIPQLATQEAFEYRVVLEAPTTGKRKVRALVTDTRGTISQEKELLTDYRGRADLSWSPTISPATMKLGAIGEIRVKVLNQGGDSDAAVRLRVELPKNVTALRLTPDKKQLTNQEIIFEPLALASKQSTTYIIQYRAEKAGRAYFKLRLEADSLGEKALLKEQPIEISE